MVKVKLTESQLRQIIHEELVEHYLVQRELWSDSEDDQQKTPPKVNKKGRSA